MNFSSKPYVIAGPCSAESSSQLMETASLLHSYGVEWLRAGLWKPRTKPGCFEGVGSEGIPWMVRAQKELGMKICTEVSSGATASECVAAGFDAVWIGARTTSNPFLVQEIAHALKGTSVTVMVKNPLDPNLEVWAGAIERLRFEGITDIVAIHRGFSDFSEVKYRNTPNWKLALDLRSRYPLMPLLCDPSHIAGKREYVEEIALKAMSLGFDGVMVESHVNPSCALSDAAQQLVPADLASLVSALRSHASAAPSSDFEASLAELRAQIDAVDEHLLQVISDRQRISTLIGELKKANHVQVVQAARWDEVVTSTVALSDRYALDPLIVERILTILHEASVSRQNSIILSE